MTLEALLKAKRDEILQIRLLVRQQHNWVGFFTQRTLKFHGRRLLPNVLVHAYFGVDLNEVWRTVESDLPVIKQQIEALINQLQAQGGSE